MNELLNKSLSQIVNDNFNTAEVFERYGLDFCCKGKNTLERACLEKGISPKDIIPALSVHYASPDNGSNFTFMPPSDLVHYIIYVHHRYVRENAPVISKYLDKVIDKHGDRYPFMKEVASLFADMIIELDTHMTREEHILFPLIVSNGDHNLIGEEIRTLQEQHGEAGHVLEQIRKLTNNYKVPEHACTTFSLLLTLLNDFEIQMHKHVHLENNILFSRVTAKMY